MSILYLESFGSDIALLDTAPHPARSAIHGGEVYQTPGRWPGSRAMGINQYDNSYAAYAWWGIDLQQLYSTLFIGYALQIQSMGQQPAPLLAMTDSHGGWQAYMSIGPLLELVPAVGQVQGDYHPAGFDQIPGWKVAGDRPVLPGRWYYVELGIHFSAYNGWIEVRLNSMPTAAWYGTGTTRANATGNTLTTTDQGVRSVYLGTQSNHHCDHLYSYIQDVVVMDDTDSGVSGHPNNDFLGDVGVAWLQPNGPGAHGDFVVGGSSPAATTWQSLDTSAAPGDVTFASSSSHNAIDTYTLADLPASAGDVLAIRPGLIGSKTDPGRRSVTPVVRLASGPSDLLVGPTGIALPQSPIYTWQGTPISQAKPDGTPWTVAELNAAELGQKVTL